MVEESLAQELLDILASSRPDFAEVFCQKAVSLTVSREVSGETTFASDWDDGISFYIEAGGRSFVSSLGPAPPKALKAEARRLSEGEAGSNAAAKEIGRAGAPRKSDPPLGFGGWDVKGAMEQAADGASGSDPRVAGLSAILKESLSDTLRLDSKGGRTVRTEHTWAAYVKALAREGGVARSGARILAESHEPMAQAVADVAAEAGRAACLLLEARPAPAGEFPVILAPQAAGLFLHETIGRALEGDLVARRTSFLSGSSGKLVASPLLSLGQEPPLGGQYDDEGSPLKKEMLVEEGVLARFLAGRKSGALIDAPKAGSAWRASYRSMPSPLLRYMSVAAKGASLQKMLAGMEFGFYVARIGGGSFDAESGSFRFPVSEGFVVREGTIAEPVEPAEISGLAPEALKLVTAVGAKREHHPGMARRRREGIMVWDVAPAVAFGKMALSPAGSR